MENIEQSPGIRNTLDVVKRLSARLNRAVIGREAVIELLIVALLADGHVLLEDFPGSGKTTLAKALGDCLIDDMPHDEIVALRRIQFTPDLLPGDITGSTIFDPDNNSFIFRPGPLFAHIVLADEINRTSPKVQSALLEAMAEKQVTVDNRTWPLDRLFFVIATQNPLDLAGTYPLPVAQLDRFLFKIRMTTIDRGSELEVLRTIHTRKDPNASGLPTVTRSQLLRARLAMEHGVTVHPLIQEALVDTARALRSDPRVIQGVSTRSLVLAVPALQARALLRE
ncbi:MAG TPA: AAA family ATPase, partial [Myxococcota bacterium]|nr:AAA family ATPase [Myxococcota bacterium]